MIQKINIKSTVTIATFVICLIPQISIARSLDECFVYARYFEKPYIAELKSQGWSKEQILNDPAYGFAANLTDSYIAVLAKTENWDLSNSRTFLKSFKSSPIINQNTFNMAKLKNKSADEIYDVVKSDECRSLFNKNVRSNFSSKQELTKKINELWAAKAKR